MGITGSQMNFQQRPWFVLHTPEIGRQFQGLYQTCGKGGMLDKKTRELLMFVIASVSCCSDCIEEHWEKPIGAGATRDEIMETLHIVAVESGRAQLTWPERIHCRFLDDSGHK
jgi:AhpD family alkylhydroperoxidase